MILAVVWFVIGLICLIKGGDWFVEGATGLAQRLGIPELLIGATVVSIGTTLPEVMVSATSAVSGHAQIAYGNALGSIICNTALIAAITVAIRPGKAEKKALRLPALFFFLAFAFYALTAYTTGYFSRVTGVILLAVFVVYMLLTVWQMKNGRGSGESETQEEGERSLAADLGLLAVGAVLIAIGADLLVDNGTLIAKGLGVPESVIALSIVALGTSLPELVTAITALMKGHGALSLGNIIGANLFNLVLVTGISCTLAPFGIPADRVIGGLSSSLVVDIPVAFGVMALLCIPPLIKGKLYRLQGCVLLAGYAAFMIYNFIG